MPITPEVEKLAERIACILEGENVISRRMFGGICFMLNGNMLCGAWRSSLMLRVGKDGKDEALSASEHAQPFMPSGRRMKGFVTVERDGIKTDQELDAWIRMARRFVDTLPGK